MKIPKKIFIPIAAFILGSPEQIFSQGFIVPNGVFSYPSSPNTIGVIHNPFAPNDDPATGFNFIPDQSTSPNYPFKKFEFDPFTDIGVRVFLISPNDPISLQPVLSMAYPELSYSSSYVFQNNVPFYVGLYTGNFLQSDGTYGDPSFGWAELENVNGTINLLAGAIEYQGGGIYAGTDTIIPVPEPTTLTLLALVGTFLGLRRGWRDRSR